VALIQPLLGSNLASTGFDTTLIGNSVWMDGSADGFTRGSSDFDDEDGKEFTLGTWFQLTEFSVTGALFCAGNGSGTYTSLRHGVDNKIYFQTQVGNAILSTPGVYRDVGWYHVLLSVDTTQSTAGNRVRLFVNGEEVTLSGTQPALNRAYQFNTAQIHEVGDSYENGTFEGYLAQSFMIGSKSIQQSDFAITDFLDTFTFGENGSQFIPKKHTEIKTLVDAGSDNSFLLDFEPADPTASNALGLDISTYGNNFTSTSMGSANQSTNTPSKTYSTFNPLAHADNSYPGTFTLSEGNTKNVLNSSNTSVKTTLPFLMSGSNIIRAQFTFSTIGHGGCGITGSSHTSGTYHTAATSVAGRGEVGLCGSGALVIDGNFNNSYTSALSDGDVVDVIVNCNVGAVYFAVDGTLLGGATQSEIQAGTTTNAALVSSFVRRTAGEVFNFYAFQFNPTSSTVEYNSGQSSFTHSYSTITSLKSLNTADLPAPTYQGIDFFKPLNYTGTSGGSLIAQGTGTPTGDMTSGGGLAAAFDGDIENYAAGAYRGGTAADIGKDFGSGVTKTVTGVVVKMLGNASIDGGAGTETMTLTVQRSDNGSDWTQIFTESGISVAAGAVITRTSGFSNTAAARYARIVISHGGGGEIHVSELEFYENSSATNAITGVGWKPDLVWIKDKGTSAGVSHALYDVVRGTTKQIETDTTAVETTESQGLTTFGSDGFTVGTLDQVNDGGTSFISWNWLAGGSASSNGSGSITSSVSAAAPGHFSIVSWTGNTTAGATVGHGLGGTPEFIIGIARNQSGENKPVYHLLMTADTDHLKINETNAQGTAGTTIWDESAMSSTLIGVGAAAQSNSTNGMIAYCFRSVPGVCKVGTYEGNNNSNGTYVSLGFKPNFFMAKNIDATGSWFMLDGANGFHTYSQAESNAQQTSGTVADRLSDGLKWRTTGGGNASNTFVYLALSELGGNGTLPPISGVTN